MFWCDDQQILLSCAGLGFSGLPSLMVSASHALAACRKLHTPSRQPKWGRGVAVVLSRRHRHLLLHLPLQVEAILGEAAQAVVEEAEAVVNHHQEIKAERHPILRQVHLTGSSFPPLLEPNF